MTAPVAPVAPQTPAAPVVPETPREIGQDGIDDAISAISRDAVAKALAQHGETLPVAGATPVAEAPSATPDANAPITRAEDGATWNATAGRWKLADGSFAAGAAPENAPIAAAPTPAAAEDAPAAPVLPEGMVAVPKIEGRELATPFKLFDPSGAELEIPNLTMEITANGKVRREPLDKVARLAQFGVYNEEREQQVVATRQHAQSAETRADEALAYARKMQQAMDEIMGSDEAYLMARARYEQENSPAAVLERERAQHTQEREQHALLAASQQGDQFFLNELQPALGAILEGCPTLSADEIGARMLLVSDRFRVHTPFGSIIPPNAFQSVRDAILSDVVPWAQQVHDHNSESRKTQDAEREKQIRDANAATARAQADAQKSKSLVGRVGQPGNRGGTSTGTGTREAPKPQPIRTVDDAERAVLRDTLAAMSA